MPSDNPRSNGNGFIHQRRDEAGGAFTADGERHEYAIGCKVTSNELRQYSILFDQHRKSFGWQTMSDMYRDLLKEGMRNTAKKIKNPSRDMTTMMELTEELDRAVHESRRHRRLDEVFTTIEESVSALMRAGDLGAIRELLGEFKERNKRITDRALKYKREMEFDSRWGRLWKELNAGASLTKFEEE